MKIRIMTLLLAAAALIVALAGCSDDTMSPKHESDDTAAKAGLRSPGNGRANAGQVVVANRASGSISVIDARTSELVGTHDLPLGEAAPEPMYVNHSSRTGRVFVGDRANDRVVVFNARTYEVETTVPAGQGVFHQWCTPKGRQLWVNNDIDNTITVIDVVTLQELATIGLPADLVAMGGKPHDVVLDHRNRHAFVTVLGVDGSSDYLVQYDTATFTELTRQPVGKDPHVALGVNTDLYVPCQNNDQVLVFDPMSLDLVTEITVPGAHGAAMAGNGKQFYTTNLPGGGQGAIYTIGTRRNAVAGLPVDTPYPVPHNLVATPDGKRLFVTHSGGSADKVTIYNLVGKYGQPEFMGEVTVGLNPFGIGYVY